MEGKEFDNWMKEELTGHRSEVSDNSWDRLEFMLDSQAEIKSSRNRFPIFKIAAAVSLLIVSSFSIYLGIDYLKSKEAWLQALNSIQVEELQAREVSEVKKIELPIQSVVMKKIILEVQPSTQINISKKEKLPQIEEEMLVVENIVDLEGQNNKEEIFQETSEQMTQGEELKLPIKITYTQSSTELASVGSDRKIRVRELFNASKEFQAGELWADIRGAKNKLLDDPFGINKEQRQKLK